MIKIHCNGELAEDDLKQIATIVKEGGVIVYPTETVYGIGCDPRNKEALERIFRLKERPLSGNVSVAFGTINETEEWIAIPSAARNILSQYTPGPLTVLIPRPKEMDVAIPPSALFGIRIPSHPTAQKLLSFTGPLISTSANRHGTQPTENEAKRIGQQCDALILCDGVDGEASTVVAFPQGESARILRKGSIDIDF